MSVGRKAVVIGEIETIDRPFDGTVVYAPCKCGIGKHCYENGYYNLSQTACIITAVHPASNVSGLCKENMYTEKKSFVYGCCGLTAREIEVIKWSAENKTFPEIAVILGISYNTVLFHLKNIYRKMSVCSRQEMVMVAMHNRVIGEPEIMKRLHSE